MNPADHGSLFLKLAVILGFCTTAHATSPSSESLWLPTKSIFRDNAPPLDVYVCSIDGHSPSPGADTRFSHGTVTLKVLKALSSDSPPPQNVLSSYWHARELNGFEIVDAQLSPPWLDFSSLPKNQLVLVSFEHSDSAKDGIESRTPRDVMYLQNDNDPIVAEVQQILRLRQAKDERQLQHECRTTLVEGYGKWATRIAVFTVINRIAPSNPSEAVNLLLLRANYGRCRRRPRVAINDILPSQRLRGWTFKRQSSRGCCDLNLRLQPP